MWRNLEALRVPVTMFTGHERLSPGPSHLQKEQPSPAHTCRTSKKTSGLWSSTPSGVPEIPFFSVLVQLFKVGQAGVLEVLTGEFFHQRLSTRGLPVEC